MLELSAHPDACFLTLTYRDEDLPVDGSLQPRDLTLFFKRLRKAIAPRRIRYYAVGEYGGTFFRPHYHVCLFGISDVGTIEAAWNRGYVLVGSLTEASAAYCVAYILKGMTGEDDERLKGKYPEFARMSRRPGIGANSVDAFAQAHLTRGGARLVAESGDVSCVFRSGGKRLPLGRYLRGKIRQHLGMDVACPEDVLASRAGVLREEAYAVGVKAYLEKSASESLASDIKARARVKISESRRRKRETF